MPFLTCINDEKQKKIIINRCQRAEVACADKTDLKIKFRDFFFQALKEEIDAMDKAACAAEIRGNMEQYAINGGNPLVGEVEIGAQKRGAADSGCFP